MACKTCTTTTSPTFNLPPLPQIAPTYLDSVEAAKLLHVSPRQVSRYVHDGELRAARVGRQWLLTRADVDAFIAAKLHASQAA